MIKKVNAIKYEAYRTQFDTNASKLIGTQNTVK